jgi:hypothetical protein
MIYKYKEAKKCKLPFCEHQKEFINTYVEQIQQEVDIYTGKYS